MFECRHVSRRCDVIFPQERELRLILLEAHDRLPQMRRHAGRILPLFDFAQQIEIMDIEGEKTAVSGMLLVRLICRQRRQDRPQPRFDLFQVALDGSTDSVLCEQRISPAGVLVSILPPQAKTEPAAMMDLIPLMLHEQEEVAEVVGVPDGVMQICLQHGTEGGLPPGLAQPLNVADRPGRRALHDDGQSMLPAEPV